ncbi:hypothetical protein BASA62_003734 [Batrachochytrium salamandrivorans]|nr:hypothetical protein BASA62_003734 [Batrachochytrium salamandrivorans]
MPPKEVLPDPSTAAGGASPIVADGSLLDSEDLDQDSLPPPTETTLLLGHESTDTHAQSASPSGTQSQQGGRETSLPRPYSLQETTAHLSDLWVWLLDQTQTVMLLSTLFLVLGLCSVIHYGMLYSLGYPTLVRSTTDPLVLDGSHPSGSLAWEHITNITQMPHMYNSNENLRVRSYIVDRIKEMQISLQSMQCASPNSQASFLIDSLDNTNVMLHSKISPKRSGSTDYYESSNVMARIQGRSSKHEALLISAHFDSVLFAPGVTDDGISIGSMLATLKSLLVRHCRSQLEYDIIFNFNNGEEMYLLGGSAFVRHPWMKDVKAFMNLEGTGAAQGTRSQLFRTNSLPMAEEYMANAPFPHASIISNYLISGLPSETDYRPYTVDGRIPGIDIAFYSNRYLYHTPRDDIDHAKPIVAQHMSENIMQIALALCEKPSMLADLDKLPDISDQDTSKLPVPNFVFYDIAGTIGIIRSHSVLLMSFLTLLLAGVVVSVVKLASMYYRLGFKRLVTRGIKPFFEAMALVWFSFISVFLAVYTASSIKHHFNPAASYSRPILSLSYSVALIIGLFCLIQIIWPVIASKLRLRDATPFVMYHELPVAPPSIDHYDTVDRDEAVDEFAPSTDLEGQPVGQNGQVTGETHRSMRPAIPSGPSLAAWLPFGLLGFWMSLLLVNLVLNVFNISAFIYIHTWAFYSALACTLTLCLESSMRRWYRLGMSDFGQEVDHSADHLEHSILKYYEEYFWLVNFVIATTIPFIQTFDLLHMFVLGIPPLIAEGLPGPTYDTLVAAVVGLLLINTLPVLSLCHRRLTASVMFFIFGVLWLTSIMTYSFSPDRPQALTYMEVWDISNGARTPPTVIINVLPSMKATDWKHTIIKRHTALGDPSFLPSNMSLVCENSLNTCTVKNATALINNSTLPSSELITVTMFVRRVPSALSVEGVIVGPPNSRICQIHAKPVDEEAVSLVKGFWIDPWVKNKWINGPNRTFEDPGKLTRGIDYSVPLNLYRRGYEGQGVQDKRIRIPFLIYFDTMSQLEDYVLTVSCFMGVETSPTFHALNATLPDWMLFKDGRMEKRLLPYPFGSAGAVAISKTVSLPNNKLV